MPRFESEAVSSRFQGHSKNFEFQGVVRRATKRSAIWGLAQQRYVKSHRNGPRSPRSGPPAGRPYRPIGVTGVGRSQDSIASSAGITSTCRKNSARSMTRPKREELLQAVAHGSAAAWGHLNLLGEYDFSEDKLQDSVGIKLPKLTD
jgi:hypothetical protein